MGSINDQTSALRADDLVVVTGAAQGFGRAIGRRLALSGARLALWDIDERGAAETAALCCDEGAPIAQGYRVDLGVENDIERVAKRTRDEIGLPFALINNGAIFPRTPILKLSAAEWNHVLAVNLTGAFLCSRQLAPMMVESKRGVIVNISSTTAYLGDPNGAHYSAAKAGLISLTKSLARALAADNIRVNTVVPGIADTAQPLGAMTRDELLARSKVIPLGRIGQPEDIAGTVAYLLSADAAYITGQALAVNGGAFMLP